MGSAIRPVLSGLGPEVLLLKGRQPVEASSDGERYWISPISYSN